MTDIPVDVGTMLLDSRAGSAELEAPLRAAGLSPHLCVLPAGDMEIIGSGPGGRPLLVGVEFKLIPDMLRCVRDGRFAEQARGMRARYEVCWLLVEGEWRGGRADGLLEVRERGGWQARGRHTYQEAAAWLLTMAQRGRTLLWRTQDRRESVAWLRTLYWWWTCKELGAHRAHLDWYTPPYVSDDPMDLEPPSMVQKVAAALLSRGPTVDVNGERARAAAARFRTVREMMAADEKVWRSIEGIGAKTAQRMMEAVR